MDTIIFTCHDCAYHNKQYMGTKGFEWREYEFEALSEIFTHMLDNRTHYVTTTIKKETEDRA